MPKTPTKTSKKAKAPAKRATTSKVPAKPAVRKLKTPPRKWYNPLSWRHKPPVPKRAPLPKARKLFAASVHVLWRHKKVFLGIATIYGLLNIVLVRGFAGSSDLVQFKSLLDSVFSGVTGKIAGSFTSFIYLLASSGSSSSDASAVYQTVLTTICSLAIVWTLRQVVAERSARVRDGFYQGMYPLVQFVLVLCLLGVQLIPLVLGSNLWSTVVGGGIAVHAWEKIGWGVLCALGAIWSLRMVTASVFALYIVTLPGMTPMRAYRNARQLVYGRRLLVWRKLIFLPITLFILACAIMLPLILFLTPIAVWLFFVLTMLALPLVHSYMYHLYRGLIA